VISYYLTDTLLEYPKDLPWLKPRKDLLGNPSWIRPLLVLGSPNFRQIVLTVLTRSKMLNDYPSVDVSSIEKPIEDPENWNLNLERYRKRFGLLIPNSWIFKDIDFPDE